MVTLSREAIIAGLIAAARIRDGELPSEAEIAAAPRLEGWAYEPMGGGLYRLVGVVTGHPSIPDGYCHTSAVLVLAGDLRWARTVSRVYSLGQSVQEMLDRSRPG